MWCKKFIWSDKFQDFEYISNHLFNFSPKYKIDTPLLLKHSFLTRKSNHLNKIYNFSPGPSKLPQSVIDKVEKSINRYKLTGKSILEISHRSIEFDEILNEINNNFLNLFNFPNDVNILLLQGGATFQNSLIPMNIDERCKLGCFVTGTWGKKTS